MNKVQRIRTARSPAAGPFRTEHVLLCLFTCLFYMLPPCEAENYLINGGQESQIDYKMEQRVQPAPATRKLILSYVMPENFQSPTYSQKITRFDLRFSVNPSERKESRDERGNRIIQATWKKPRQPITATLSLAALNSTKLARLKTRAPFPLDGLGSDIKEYLRSTRQVEAGDPAIRRTARELTAGAETEFDAVQKILTWVVDHMSYVLIPESYTASYAFRHGKGNCQNYSHLAAALMRSAGIPVRIVNGITLKQAYDITTGGGVMTMKMAQGRHSWIEVFFPDLGWVPFDPQQMQLFVSNRFIRVEVGLDNEETANDGLVRWTQSRGTQGRPGFQESIEANFASDQVALNAEKQNYGPKKLLFTPPVEAVFKRIIVEPPPPPPEPVPPKKLEEISYTKPNLFGNLEFPDKIDFLTARGPARRTDEQIEGEMEMRKNFLVETAEYVTTQGRQYAQTFILDRPMKLGAAGLALHKFGGDGQLWLELMRDDGSGRPGEPVATTEILPMNRIPAATGYDWVDFTFNDRPLLSPGRYWVALGFTGSPIVNWFFSYGKPVGPADGTRYRTIFDVVWSRSLSFEFNYRIAGLTAE